MDRREYVAAAFVAATAGCLRLESDDGTSTTRADDRPETTTAAGTSSTGSEETMTDGADPVVDGFAVAWTHEDAGAGKTFRPDVLVSDGDTVLAFGSRVARVDPSEPATLASADLTSDGAVRVGTTECVTVTEDAIFAGTGDGPRVVRLSRDASTVEWAFDADASLESVGDIAVVDDTVYAGVRARGPDRAVVYALDVKTGERRFVREWGDGHYLTSVTAHDDVVFLGVGGTGAYPNALDTGTRELFHTETRLGFEALYRLRATGHGLLGVGDERLTLHEWGSFDRRFEQSLIGYPSTAPDVHDGTVYVANEPGVRAVDVDSGTERWLARTTDRVRVRPAFDGAGVAFVADDADILYALDVATGEILHEAQPFEYPVKDVTFVDGSLVLATNGLRGIDVVRE
jgi:outer membrane protein assembly factor BamB